MPSPTPPIYVMYEAAGAELGAGFVQSGYAAPATYLAVRPQFLQRSVTCDAGGGGAWSGSRSIVPEQDGQLGGVPWRSLLMRFSA